ncbi:hypothetical protein FEM48_Zijuj11G0062300 [Ziziphus jujuba var. spinosa]|uniref:Nuclease HARBI1 n=1 Tax=Ziziphus jujuba var. spinosa TaxID=714518 RepID=A0A978UHA9_ZIZJJ|nr:hypothetical protein FEM48_Zijuj11G0062300 [Ziziphus jujuba var. spinosa]
MPSTKLFKRILDDSDDEEEEEMVIALIESEDPYFVQKRDAAGIFGLSSLQKITAAMRMLVYRVTSNFIDEYVRIDKSTTIESLKRFVKVIISIFIEKYMRSPNKDDIARLLKENEVRGFPGMLRSIDCLSEGHAPPTNYSINCHDYTMGYYLVDGIYHPWSTFMKTIPFSKDNKHKRFVAAQESAIKDME